MSDPFIVHWPKGIKSRGEVRTQYAHLIDIVPTVLDVLGIEAPATIRGVTQSPIQGVSLAYGFDDAAADTHHPTQYFEMIGHRAIDHDGWRAVCPWPGPSFAEAGKGFGEPISAEALVELDAKGWELYRVAEDMTENHNVAGQHPDKLRELVALWYVEAGKYDVLPIDGNGIGRMITERPQVAEDRDSYVYRPGTSSVPFAVAPRVLNRPHSVTADVEVPAGGAEGILMSQGSAVGGWSFYLLDGKLRYAHNYLRSAMFTVSTPDPVPEGRHALRFEFEPTGQPDFASGRGAPGRAQLYVDGKLKGETDLPYTTLLLFNPGGLTCGVSGGSAVTPDYEAPFPFTGTLHSVTIDLSGDLIKDSESDMRMAMARQ